MPLGDIGFSFALACDLNGRPYPHCPGHIPMVSIETPLPAWSCHTGTMAIFTFMACLKIGRVLLNVRIVPPNPRGGDNTEKYCHLLLDWGVQYGYTSIPCSAYKLNRSSVVQKSVMQKGLEEKSSKNGVGGCNALKLLCTTVDCSTKDSTACGRFYNQCYAAHCKR